ncbi:MAG: SDR family oxidoreductase [Acidimicrobiales bacterium]|nr:SDR family oxidoreductase [Acidimicrobiales bacterium]
MALPPPSPTTTALVTGASSGIGADLARELAARGHGLTLVARREDKLKALAAELHDRKGVRTEVVALDLTDPTARGGLPATLAERGLSVDVLVNNAGFSTTGPVYRSDREREMAMIRTDVEAVVDLCSIFLPGMVERGRGAVLNVASTAAFQPLPGQAGYGASKAFVLSYSRSVRAELRGTGVTLTVLCPGPVRTEFAETAGFTTEESESSLPEIMWLPAAEVARVAVAGLEQGKVVVIPGLANRVGAQFARHAPHQALAGFLAGQHPALKNRR